VRGHKEGKLQGHWQSVYHCRKKSSRPHEGQGKKKKQASPTGKRNTLRERNTLGPTAITWLKKKKRSAREKSPTRTGTLREEKGLKTSWARRSTKERRSCNRAERRRKYATGKRGRSSSVTGGRKTSNMVDYSETSSNAPTIGEVREAF